MRFSRRTEWDTEESELARAYRQRREAGLPIADLTASNPTRCGFAYPEELLEPLTDPAALEYEPDPRGSHAAREAVCAYYASHGAKVLPQQMLLTTSTSEAYGYLFKVLCDPGDAVLVPQPSYPLFEFLADGEVVRVDFAPLVYDHGWQLDLEGLRRSVTPETRAVIVVHPNNPTGHFMKLEEALGLAEVCREFGLALIVDEVFLDYGLEFPSGAKAPSSSDDSMARLKPRPFKADEPEERYGRSLHSSSDAMGSFIGLDLGILVFVVSGISKICGLPQMKVAWLVATGPGSEEALERLDVVADTYLSMNAPVQQALPGWLAGRAGIEGQIRERVRGNLAELDQQLARLLAERGDVLVNRLIVEGGWYAVLRIPAIQPDEMTVRELLAEGVWVHPGYFFGMGRSGWLVVSLLAKAEDFSTGVVKLLAYMQRNQESYL